MCLCTLCADRFLRGVYRCGVFRAYCRTRGIDLPGVLPERTWGETTRWWAAAVAGLPTDARAAVEWEQLALCELGTWRGCAHLLDVVAAGGSPPAGVPSGPPLALWFLMRHPALFTAVYRNHHRREPDVWVAGRAAPGLPLPDPAVAEVPLASTVGAFFREVAGTDGRCVAVAHRVPGAIYLSARVPGRSARTESFSRPPYAGVRVSPPVGIDCVYYPADGTVLLRSALRVPERVTELLDAVGRATLGSGLGARCPRFALDRLREPFDPLPPGDDVEAVRVKALHLRYPRRSGRREIRLHTLASDRPSAIPDLVRAHAGPGAHDLEVSHAVLQLRLRVEGVSKTHVVRLWPDRCDAGEGPVRTRTLACLRAWGI